MKARLPRKILPVVAIACGAWAYGGSADAVDLPAKLSLEWVKTRAETVRTETDWAGQRDMLTTTVNALEERAHELEAKRDLLKAKTAKDRNELTDLEIENQQLTAQFQQLEAHLKTIDERLTRLRPQLPPRLSQALELPLRSLAAPDLPPSERMAHTITVLNRCAQFNRSITSGEEIVTVPGEPGPKLLQTIYWGLSHGYASDPAAHQAWIGSPHPEGWSWTPCTESEGAIREMIGTLDGKAEPKFVAVPAAAGHPAQSNLSK